jgi:predicted nucleic acid-binding protein
MNIYRKYTQVFESKRGKEILQKLIDLHHAATCLQEGAVLITNDSHFDEINNRNLMHPL